MPDVARIAMWSGPRTLSTALMHSFGNRPDTVVVDEPLYGFYLAQTGLPHPGRDEILASMPPDWPPVIAELTTGPLPPGKTVYYQKHMTHHLLPSVDRARLGGLRHAFLIRDPRRLLASYAKVREAPTLADLGLEQQLEIYRRFGGPVIDAADIARRPRPALEALCAALAIGFDESMLSWPAGPHPSDGVWSSTGTPWCGRPPVSTPVPGPARAAVPGLSRCPPGWKDSPPAASSSTTSSPPASSVSRKGPGMLQQFDERNRHIIVSVGGKLTHRDEAAVSPFDSAVQGGDAVWEGLRVYDGRIFRLDEHLARLRRSARALAFDSVPSDEEITGQIRRTLAANDMTDGVHIRLTLTRGVKITSGMDPRLNTSGPTLIVLPEYKPPVYDAAGIRLVTASIRRPAPDVLDPKIHHANLLSSILAKIEANVAGADDALMLDQRGFVAETNATNVFWVTAGVLGTPATVACPEGITRDAVLELAAAAGIDCAAGDYSVVQLYNADEVFATGTMGGIAPVTMIDGRIIGDGHPGPVTGQLTGLLAKLAATTGTIVA